MHLPHEIAIVTHLEFSKKNSTRVVLQMICILEEM
jgi:hypothetical protein